MKAILVLILAAFIFCVGGCASYLDSVHGVGKVGSEHDKFDGTTIDYVQIGRWSFMQRHTQDNRSGASYSVHYVFHTDDVNDLYNMRLVYLLDDSSKIEVHPKISNTDVSAYGYTNSAYFPITRYEIERLANTATLEVAFYDRRRQRDEAKASDSFLLNIRKFHHLFVLDNPEWTKEDEARHKTEIRDANKG